MSAAEQLRDTAFALINSGFDVRVSDGVVSVRAADATTAGAGVRLSADGLDELPSGLVEEIYWANYYAHHSRAPGSSFQAAVSERADLPRRVIDLGCGDGRDSFAFGRDGRTVVGVDRSHVGIAHASRHAATVGLGDAVAFRQCDVGDPDQLRSVLAEALRPDEPALFYARFFLHSIPAAVQATLMSAIAALARPGDHFAAEFRTTADQTRPKTYDQHYRRYQDGPEFGRTLAADYGFTVLFEHEGSGLSPYGTEDPVLYRVIARR
ncbi:class I SAM-dependent methyltransferase [uncultured Jatrophihabitans sp.]|uniref:class I SAM-dependent methyltransferase n=1 Tax=uncultured Jatrophihabitans sp. TaxID=1610747 RepID=UPI0035CA8161